MSNLAQSRRSYRLQALVSFLLLAGCSTRLAAQSEQGFIIEFDLSQIYFEETVFRGDTAHVGLSLAYAFNSSYEIGYSFSDNLIFQASLDGGAELDEMEDIETETRLLYLRRYWNIGNKTTAFGLIGYAKTGIRSEITSACFFILRQLRDH